MACHAAMVEKMVTVKDSDTVENVIAKMKKSKVSAVPVVNKDGELEGVFSYAILFQNILPVNVALTGGVPMDMTVGAAPGIAKRLGKVLPLSVGTVMSRKVNAVHPETPTWEGVKLLLQHGEPLLVLERETEKLMGMITTQSAFEEFFRMQE